LIWEEKSSIDNDHSSLNSFKFVCAPFEPQKTDSLVDLCVWVSWCAPPKKRNRLWITVSCYVVCGNGSDISSVHTQNYSLMFLIPPAHAKLAWRLQFLQSDDCRRVSFGRARWIADFSGWNKLFGPEGTTITTIYLSSWTKTRVTSPISKHYIPASA